ncbi:MAG: F-type H+-transporting ATPase subunit a [Actinomycetota bacterium]|jgi:F-type H+-transporting ATPase subunit a|nr:F-type H+-transporting ATPase subunit a [Actinomycetota bacterium]
MLLGLDVPPLDELTNWPPFAFKNSDWLALNKVGLIYLLAMALTLAIFIIGGSKKQLVPHGIQNVAEVGVEFVRDQVVMQTIGSDGLVFLPYLTALFFFIFFSNIFEIIPYFQMPANARIAMPLVLALVTYAIFNVVGIAKQGPLKYVKNAIVPPGVPKAILPLVVVIELVSYFLVRPFSLMVRLFANMLAGHLILATFSVICTAVFKKSILVIILPFSFGLLFALTGFEILVSFLQAFIFTILTAVYIGGSMHPEH